MSEKKSLSLVVPIYNEEKNIPVFVDRAVAVLEKLCKDSSYEIIFALDPSKDASAERVVSLREKNPNIKLLLFSRRFGQPIATMAGINYASGDAVVVIDVDLQDPPELISELVRKWREEDADVVYAQRRTREGETFIKKAITHVGYYVINKITDIKIPRNTGDFRLMDRKVVTHLNKMTEKDFFLRGLVSYVGFKQTNVLYDRDPRLSGLGNYNRYLGSLTIAFNGIFCFSRYPLHLISVVGGSLLILAVLLLILSYFFSGHLISGHLLILIAAMAFFTSLLMLAIGIVAEYLARMYDGILQRPAYIVDRAIGFSFNK
ncbi:MAG: glycosyltransferase family 2 protein [Oligoflexia bacterium]|nr:glycosyltransferase family 2 protein [Oligoflexia bacterium]